MKTASLATTTFILLVSASPLLAQDTPPLPEPQKEHQWLEQFVGQWESESQSVPEPGQPTMTCKGTMTSRMLGGIWVVSESTADMMGNKFSAIQTIGYDPAAKKYVGTWIDSMLSHMWKYEGFVDDSGKKLTLEAEGPNLMTDGQMARFRDAYEFKSPDHILFTSSIQDEDGQWNIFMTGDYRRKK